jgi:hypothetical protein
LKKLFAKLLFFIQWIKISFSKILLGCVGMHSSNGLPVNPTLHLHWGTWLVTMQSAFRPQIPSLHGSAHFKLMHALSRSHSELLTHSGRHPRVGSPRYPGRQVQMQLFPATSWLVLAPQGFGLHGLFGFSGSATMLSVCCNQGRLIERESSVQLTSLC